MRRTLDRRAMLSAMPLLALACARRDSEAKGATPKLAEPGRDAGDGGGALHTRFLVWTFADDAPSPVVVGVVPTWSKPGDRLPVVVAFSGIEAARRPPAEGVMAWPREYGLARAIERLRTPPLTTADYATFVTSDELRRTNADLAAHPFEGVITVCPFVAEPGLKSDAVARAYPRFLMETLLPRVHRETPASLGREATGICGAGVGGAFALRIGLQATDVFGAVSAIQPALQAAQAEHWAEIARKARERNPKLKLRMVTSNEDPYRVDITRTSEALRAAGVDHALAMVPGPSGEAFQRGAGAYELLLWHASVLERG